MKKLLLSAAFAVCSVIAVNAQEVKFGVKAGPQIANLNGDVLYDGLDKSSKFGFHAGVYANIKFGGDQFAFQPELLFSTQGAKIDGKFSETLIGETINYDADIKYNLTYLNVPLMVKWYAYEGFNVEFGPQVGFNMSGKVKGDMTASALGITETVSFDDDIEDIETIDFGLNIGAGYELESGLNFGIRYGLGLTEIGKNGGPKNSVFSLSVGYAF